MGWLGDSSHRVIGRLTVHQRTLHCHWHFSPGGHTSSLQKYLMHEMFKWWHTALTLQQTHKTLMYGIIEKNFSLSPDLCVISVLSQSNRCHMMAYKLLHKHHAWCSRLGNLWELAYLVGEMGLKNTWDCWSPISQEPRNGFCIGSTAVNIHKKRYNIR